MRITHTERAILEAMNADATRAEIARELRLDPLEVKRIQSRLQDRLLTFYNRGTEEFRLTYRGQLLLEGRL